MNFETLKKRFGDDNPATVVVVDVRTIMVAWQQAMAKYLIGGLLLPVFAGALLTGCSGREKAGQYVLVTPMARGPDHHPGTSLQRGRTVVWGNVYTGYFYPHPANRFAHDGMFLFVALIPVGGDWSTSQLFVVRGNGPPVLLTERLTGGSSYEVDQLTLTNEVFEVHFGGQGTHKLSWTDVRRLLEEGEASARLVSHELGTYRVLSVR